MNNDSPFDEEPDAQQSDVRSPQLPSLRSPSRGTAVGDTLAFYLAEVRRYPLLSLEEERAYAVRYTETGDREAAERLVTANLRRVCVVHLCGSKLAAWNAAHFVCLVLKMVG